MEATGRRVENAGKCGAGRKLAMCTVHGALEKFSDSHPMLQNSRKLTVEGRSAPHGNCSRTTPVLDGEGIAGANSTRSSNTGTGCSAVFESGRMETDGANGEPIHVAMGVIRPLAGMIDEGFGEGEDVDVPLSRAVERTTGETLEIDRCTLGGCPVESQMGDDGMDLLDVMDGGGCRGMIRRVEDLLPKGRLETMPECGIEDSVSDVRPISAGFGASPKGKLGSVVEANRDRARDMKRVPQRGASRGRSKWPGTRNQGGYSRSGTWTEDGSRNIIQPGRTFASLLNANPIGKKMKMDYVEPVMEGDQPVFAPQDEVILQAKQKWENYLVGYFISGSLMQASVERAARGYWGKFGLGRILADATGFYFFEIPDANERAKILEEGPWLFFGRGMVLQQWTSGLALCKQTHNKIPLWARFHKVPLTLWTAAGLSGVASLVGKPLYADSYTESMEKIDFARICVEVEARKPLPDTVRVLMAGEIIHIPVDYQWKPMRCAKCEVFGHICKTEQDRQQFDVALTRSTGQMQTTSVHCTGEKDGFTVVQNKKKAQRIVAAGRRHEERSSAHEAELEANIEATEEQNAGAGQTQKIVMQPVMQKEQTKTNAQDETRMGQSEIPPCRRPELMVELDQTVLENVVKTVMSDANEDGNLQVGIKHQKRDSNRSGILKPVLYRPVSLSTEDSDGSTDENFSDDDTGNSGSGTGQHLVECDQDAGKQATSREESHFVKEQETQMKSTAAQVVAAIPSIKFQGTNQEAQPKKARKSSGGSKSSKTRRR